MILVTGAAGFIGFHLTQRLLAEGHSVIGIDNLDSYYDVGLKLSRLDILKASPKFTFLQQDFGQLEKKDLADVDCVFHQAARAGVRPSISDPEPYVRVNVASTVRLLKLSADSGVPKFVFASSSSVYGDTETFPITESHPTKPKNPYGASKLAAETFCDAFYSCYGLPCISLRYFTVYGPWGRPDMFLFKLLDSCYGGGPFLRFKTNGTPVDFRRSFTFVSDIVEANLLAMKRPLKNATLNIGAEKDVAIDAVIRHIARETGREPRSIDAAPNPADMLRTYADISKARRMLGYEPKVGIEEGIKKTVQWYKTYRRVA